MYEKLKAGLGTIERDKDTPKRWKWGVAVGEDSNASSQ
jgi:hypothetical protein